MRKGTFPRSQVGEGGGNCWAEQRQFSTAGPRLSLPTTWKPPPRYDRGSLGCPNRLETFGMSQPVLTHLQLLYVLEACSSSPQLCHLPALPHWCLPSCSASRSLRCVGIITCGVEQEASSPSIIATDVEIQEQMRSNSYVAAWQNKNLYWGIKAINILQGSYLGACSRHLEWQLIAVSMLGQCRLQLGLESRRDRKVKGCGEGTRVVCQWGLGDKKAPLPYSDQDD